MIRPVHGPRNAAQTDVDARVSSRTLQVRYISVIIMANYVAPVLSMLYTHALMRAHTRVLKNVYQNVTEQQKKWELIIIRTVQYIMSDNKQTERKRF